MDPLLLPPAPKEENRPGPGCSPLCCWDVAHFRPTRGTPGRGVRHRDRRAGVCQRRSLAAAEGTGGPNGRPWSSHTAAAVNTPSTAGSQLRSQCL
ncbi:hypothetical protein NDU88_002600 [Pleurodeles waltl]|uniref:Uncharacterized protein n=1 Tax=Pleurodeles waltl TaxID=8319 RepID=A0AAV7TMF0_PLEWA|nr:hypothetical protein NDU88_002600 [Pleurodeles waltl]